MWSDSWYIEDKEAYYVGGQFQALFKTNLDSMETEIMAVLPVKNLFSFRGHPDCLKMKEKIYCLPDVEKDIFIFDMISSKWKKIELDYGKSGRFLMKMKCKYDGILFLGSVNCGRIIGISNERDEIVSDFSLPLKNDEDILSGYAVKNKFFFLSNSANIYCFDCINKKLCKLRIDIDPKNAMTFLVDKNIFWVSGQNETVYRFSMTNEISTQGNEIVCCNPEAKTMPMRNVEFEDGSAAFSTIKKATDSIWLIPVYANRIYYISLEDNKVSYIEVLEEKGKKTRGVLKSEYIAIYMREDRFIGVYSMILDCIIEIDTVTKKYTIRDFGPSRIDEHIMSEIFHKNSLVLGETQGYFTLENFIRSIQI